MKNAICTIITNDYGHYALAQHDTFLKYGNNESFFVFVSKGKLPEPIYDYFKLRSNVFIIYEEEFRALAIAKLLKDKYEENYHDAYRWSMKPVLISYLLQKGYDRVLYVDSDLFFYNSFEFLFDELSNNGVLLSPHWRSSSPTKDLTNFRLNFLDGIYNGGFVGASKRGIEALLYWAELCLHTCEVNRKDGYYVDQRYLDILPTRFEGINHITHKGCNVANWNLIDCKRTLQDNGEVLINGEYPIVFIHFTNSMLDGILLGKDTLLKPYLDYYKNTLLKYSDIDIVEAFYSIGIHIKPRAEKTHTQKQDSTLLKVKKKFLKYLKNK